MSRFNSFKEFYPFYLSQHTDLVCRRLHVLGSLLVLVALATVVLSGQWAWLVLVPFVGYGFAWVGHYVFEKNKPATFSHPVYSFIGDWVMLWQALTGKVRL
ncbi:Mpo1-like protein [Aquabacterium sp.]|uniref:Mpo1-like protein n=1 Tax=Aquabacterium sp. TaxID=1872578 RepID=UPI003D6D758B